MTATSPTSSVASDVTPPDAVRSDAPARWRQRTSPSMPRGSPCTTLPAFFERVGEVALVTALATLDAGQEFCANVGSGAGGSVFSSSSLHAIAAHPATRTTAHHVGRGIRISTTAPRTRNNWIRKRELVSNTADSPTTGISRTCIYTAAGRAIGARDPDPSVRNPDFLAEKLLGDPAAFN